MCQQLPLQLVHARFPLTHRTRTHTHVFGLFSLTFYLPGTTHSPLPIFTIIYNKYSFSIPITSQISICRLPKRHVTETSAHSDTHAPSQTFAGLTCQVRREGSNQLVAQRWHLNLQLALSQQHSGGVRVLLSSLARRQFSLDSGLSD